MTLFDVDAERGDTTVSCPSVRVYCMTPSLVFSWSHVIHNGSLSKIMENSVCDTLSCRKPTDAILSRSIDLNVVYLHPVPVLLL